MMIRGSTSDRTKLEAEKLRESYDNSLPTRVWLERLTTRLGGQIEYVEDDSESESVAVAGDSFVIKLPLYVSEARNNFTIAHELAHVVLHHRSASCQQEQYNRCGSDPQEWEANRFAAELLMPEQDFRLEARRLNNDPAALARKFGVSGAAAKVRLAALAIK